jgi:alpha-glucosidase
MTTPRSLRNLIFLALGPVLVAASLAAQTLARPGWAGSGIAPQAWYKHAVVYEIDARIFADSDGDGTGDLKGIAQRLDYLRSLGVDAILLEALAPASRTAAGAHTAPINPALGTLDDFDDLSLAASRFGIRVLLDLPNPEPAIARFWLARGVAGFHIPPRNPAGQPNDDAIQAIRKLLPSYVGQRVLITEAPTARPSPSDILLDTDLLKLPAPPGTGTAPTVAAPTVAAPTVAAPTVAAPTVAAPTVAAPTVAAPLRAALEHSQALVRSGSTLLATDAPGLPLALRRFAASDQTPGHAAAISRILATALLLSRANALLGAGEELALAAPGPMPWGAPAAPPPSMPITIPETAPAPPKPTPPAAPGVYVPYVAPTKPAAAKPAPPPDPASAAGQDLDPHSVLNFYRQLIQLHHGNTAIRDGDQTFLDEDTLNALIWVRTPPSPSLHNPPLIILCNLSDRPLILDLKPALARLHLRGSFLKTILRSDDALGSMDISPVHVPPYGVFIGELKF